MEPATKETMTQFLSQIKENADKFSRRIPFPLATNRVTNVVKSDEEAYRLYTSTRPIVHRDVLALMAGFLEIKRNYGSKIEKQVYASITSSEQFLTRLLQLRAVTFVGRMDGYVLRDGTPGFGSYETIGKNDEKSPLLLESYLSYDEIKIAALLGLSSETKFINDGERYNKGKVMEDGTFQQEGVIVGLVGPRFARPGVMEYHDMVVDPKMSTAKNGFGAELIALKEKASVESVELNKLWARFYHVERLPSHHEVKKHLQGGNIVALPKSELFFNLDAYSQRIEILAESLLLEANVRAKSAGKKAHVYVVGFGLGVWCLKQIQLQQNQYFLDAFGSALSKLKLKHVSTVEFGWIAGDVSKYNPLNKALKIVLSKNSPQTKLEDPNELLVVSYAWDGNAYPGNEYWEGHTSGSGDSAAASCSMIGELQNPAINAEMICGSKAKILSMEHDDL